MKFHFTFSLCFHSIFLLLFFISLQVWEGENVCADVRGRFSRVFCFSDLNVTNLDLYKITQLSTPIDCLSWCAEEDVCGAVFFDTRYNTCAVYRSKWTSETIITEERKSFLVYRPNDNCDVVPEPECFRNVNGTPWYTGRKTTTISGITCQRWDQQTPHYHHNTDPAQFPEDNLSAAENFCRNPDEASFVWCYSMDNNPRYDMCGIPECP